MKNRLKHYKNITQVNTHRRRTMKKITRLIFVLCVFVSACTCLVGCKRKMEIEKPVGQKSDLASVVVEEEGPALTRLEDDGSWIATAS